MSESGVYEDEMGRLSNLADADIDRLFAGRAPAGEDGFDELAAHLRTLKASFIESPSEVAEARHVAAIAKAAQLLAENGEPVARPASKAHGPDEQASGLPKQRRTGVLRNRFVSLTAKVAAGAVGFMALSGGLAYAGVDLPEQVDQVFARLGIELPEQTADAGKPEDMGKPEHAAKVSEFASSDVEKGCEFGQAVAELADDRSEAVRRDDVDKPDPCTQDETTEPRGSKATGDERSAAGRAIAEEASTQRRHVPDETDSSSSRSSAGMSTADEASVGKSSAGRSTGEAASQMGQSYNPTDRP